MTLGDCDTPEDTETQSLWSTTRLGYKPCTDTDWAYEKKPSSAHDDDWTDLVRRW